MWISGNQKFFRFGSPNLGFLKAGGLRPLHVYTFCQYQRFAVRLSHIGCVQDTVKKGENAPHISIINTSVVPRTGNSIKPPKCRLTQTEMLEFLISLARHHQLEFHLHFPVDGYGCAWLPPAWATDEQLLNLRRLLPLPLPPYMTRTFLGAKLYTYSKKMQA